MPDLLPVGRVVLVGVPATSANLGPGFDCFGLALDWRDRIELEVIDAGCEVQVSGEGAGSLPSDETHLIIATVRRGLAELGVRAPGLRLRGHNTIPHGRGLGSSSAAIVGALVGARALAGLDPDPGWVLELAVELEGHPDNVAAATYGGFVLAYGTDQGTAVAAARVADGIRGAVYVPEFEVETRRARGLLPAAVPHADAAADAGRAALLVHALAVEPGLLFEATRDWLHQAYRHSAMPQSYGLLTRLRTEGHAAVISGAGPTVLVLGTAAQLAELPDVAEFSRRGVAIGSGAGVLTYEASTTLPGRE